MYALTAVTVSDRHLDEVSTVMESLLFRKNVRVHWRIERSERRALIIERLRTLPFHGLVTVCLHRAEVKAERARRYCLRRLLRELSERGIDQVIIESRHEALDARDRSLLTGMRKAYELRPRMKVSWSLANSHPGLWVADCVAGAATWWLGGEGRFFGPIEDRVALIDIDVS